MDTKDKGVSRERHEKEAGGQGAFGRVVHTILKAASQEKEESIAETEWRSGYYVDNHDWPVGRRRIPLDGLYDALNRIPDYYEAAMDSLAETKTGEAASEQHGETSSAPRTDPNPLA